MELFWTLILWQIDGQFLTFKSISYINLLLLLLSTLFFVCVPLSCHFAEFDKPSKNECVLLKYQFMKHIEGDDCAVLSPYNSVNKVDREVEEVQSSFSYRRNKQSLHPFGERKNGLIAINTTVF